MGCAVFSWCREIVYEYNPNTILFQMIKLNVIITMHLVLQAMELGFRKGK